MKRVKFSQLLSFSHDSLGLTFITSFYTRLPIPVGAKKFPLKISFHRKQYLLNELIFSFFQVLSLLITGVACVACLTAGISAVLHLVFLYDATCQPINTVNTTCVCDGVINPTFEYFDVVTYVFGSSYHYFDLNCLQVRHILTVLLIGSSIANFLASLMLILYIYLHCSCRSGYKYSKISTRSKSQSYLYR